jgi:hypothetical protein
MKYKAIILVIASDDESIVNPKYFRPKMLDEWKPLYPTMKKVWESYMNENSSIKVVFVYGSSKLEQKNDYDLVYPEVKENSWPGILSKTLKAFSDIESNYDYDFIIRTNLSTFWDLNKLEQRLNGLKTEKSLTGTHIRIKSKDNVEYNYIAGYDMVMSRDLIRGVIPHTDEILKQPTFAKIEDLALCDAFEKYLSVTYDDSDSKNRATPVNQSILNAPNAYENVIRIHKKSGRDHFRIKTPENRNFDKQTLKELLLDFYGKTIS